MNDRVRAITNQILEAVQGDPSAIRSLTAAVAANDAAAIGSLLATRGVEISSDELAEVLQSTREAAAAGPREPPTT